MVDSYANYFCQKFFGFLEDLDRISFLVNICEHFSQIANNKIGTYPLQAVLEQLKTDREKNMVIDTIKANPMEMIYDSQGVHVVEKMIICFEEDRISFVYDLALGNFMKLANNTNGLCIIKKVIIHAKNEETIKKLLQKLIDNSFSLIQNPFGNYAIQTAVDVWKEENIMPIIKQFFNKLSNLSMQKFSSNVVEKFLQKGGETIITKYIDEISINNRIVDLMKNNYGNYVVQKALKLANNAGKNKLVEVILRNLEKIGDKKLILKWKFIVQSHVNDDQGRTILNCHNVDQKLVGEEENHPSFNGYAANPNLLQMNNNNYNMRNNYQFGNQQNMQNMSNYNNGHINFNIV